MLFYENVKQNCRLHHRHLKGVLDVLFFALNNNKSKRNFCVPFVLMLNLNLDDLWPPVGLVHSVFFFVFFHFWVTTTRVNSKLHEQVKNNVFFELKC